MVISNKYILNYTSFLLTLFFIGFSLTSCANEPQKLKIGVISDPHYLSEQLMDGGIAIQNYTTTSSKAITDVPEVLDQILNSYLNNDIEILLIPGDITKDGEKQSHIDFVKKLQPLKDKGVRIFVIPGNHDINMPNSVRYEGDKTYPVDNISPEEFSQIYADYGYSDAMKKDTASLSYVTELNKKTWLIAIDASRYREYKDRSISAGKILPETEQWITDRLNEAKEKNIQVIGMMHHGLVEHIMFQSTFFKEYLVDDWQRLAPLFADMGMKAIFTGHFHANDITEYVSGKGNKIYDIETGSLCVYPFPYRFIELNSTEMQVYTKTVTSTPTNPNLSEDNKLKMQKQAERLALNKIKNIGIQLPDSITTLFSKITGEVFVMHLAGDEVVDDKLRTSIRQLYQVLDQSETVPVDKLELDFYPADNNVKITFQQ